MRTPRKPPTRVSKPPTLSVGIVIFGFAAVLAAAGALARYYGRTGARSPYAAEAGAEIPAPDLEIEPAATESATSP
jgi:hypothetical protein